MRAIALAVFLSIGAPPDILEPGHKGVQHQLVLEWGDECRDYRFVVSPTRGFHGHTEIRRGEPFEFSSKYRTRFYAVPPDVRLPDAKERVDDVSLPVADVPVREVRSIAVGHPLARVVTTLRVVRVTAASIELQQVGERHLDANGRDLGGGVLLPLVLFAAAGAVLLAVFAYRWRSAAAAA